MPLTPLSYRQFKRSIRHPDFRPISRQEGFYNLPDSYWVYDELLTALKAAGWVRFAPGFKAGLYGNPRSDSCIKILGMGVGQAPMYFAERGYYLEHEERMLNTFRRRGFGFAPEPMSVEDAMRLLVDECGVSVAQAELRVLRHDLLVMEYIPGVAFATQTGRFLNYNINLVDYDQEVLERMALALQRLRADLARANDMDLLHNDPVPPNILFSLDINDEVTARLVDFELSQDLSVPSPDWLNSSVSELYDEREVPRNPYTGKHTKNLDQHLMDRAVEVMCMVSRSAPQLRKMGNVLANILEDADVDFQLGIPYVAGISFNLGRALQLLRGRGLRSSN